MVGARAACDGGYRQLSSERGVSERGPVVVTANIRRVKEIHSSKCEVEGGSIAHAKVQLQGAISPRRSWRAIDPCQPYHASGARSWWSDINTRSFVSHNFLNTTYHITMATAAKKKLVVCGGTGFLGTQFVLSIR